MKHLKIISFLLCTIMLLHACKKNSNGTNWAEELKGSVWAGQFKYNSGANLELQPFSIVINSNNTLTWSDIQSTRAAGTWVADGNKITLKFLNGTVLSADLSNDKWSNFTNPAINGFTLDNLSRSVIPTAAILDNTTWIGRRDSPTSLSDDVTMLFIAGNKAQIIVKSTANNITYQIEGAGIRDDAQGTYFVIFNNTHIIKGYGNYAGKILYYDLKKQ